MFVCAYFPFSRFGIRLRLFAPIFRFLGLVVDCGQASRISVSQGQASRSNIFKGALIADFMANTLRQLGKSALAYCSVWKLPVFKIKRGY